MRKKLIRFLIKVLLLPRSEIVAWTDIQNHGTKYELNLMEYDIVTMSESEILRLKHLLEELHFAIKK